MLEAKLLSAKNLEKLEQALADFLRGEHGSRIESVSGVTVIPHPTVGAATYAILVTYRKEA